MLYFTIGDEELITTDVVDPAALNTNYLYFFSMLVLFIVLMFFIKQYYKKIKTA
jgi:hypothetical protein